MSTIRKCKLIVKDGQHFVTMPNGEVIPQQVFTRVFDGTKANESYVIVKLNVELVNTQQ